MNTKRLGWRGLMAIAMLVNGAVACGDSDDDTTTTPADSGDGDDTSAGDGDDTSAGDGDDTSAGDGDEQTAAEKNIVETAVAAGSFTTLAKALVDTGLDKALAGAGPFTVFAPTDDAFEALGVDLSTLSTEALADILKYHVVSGEVESGDLVAGPVATLSGITAFVSLEGGAKINDAAVTTADVGASNGVIHVIDKVLLPPNLVKAAEYAGSFGTLLSAATTAGLAGALSAEDAGLTVFAPTDDAFKKLPAGTVEGLSNDALANVLKYHVVAAEVLSTDLTAGEVETLNGDKVTIDLTDGVKVNDAKVLVADIVTTNGVIHVIDTVLLP